MSTVPSQEELLERIRQLEAENSELQDKLDMIYSIVAPADEDIEEEDGDESAEKDDVLVQISLKKTKGVN
jgi:hypothetical protein